MQNKAQYDLDRKAPKISALSSGNLDKYEYLTGEDLNYKPSNVEQAKFDYSPLSKFFYNGLKEEDKKEGLLKGLRNIEDKSEEQLKAVKNNTEKMKEVIDFVKETLSLEANALIEEIRSIQKDVDYKTLTIKGGNNVAYDISNYKTFKELFRDIYYRNMLADEAERRQDEFSAVLNALRSYTPKGQKYNEAKNKLLDNARNFYKGREKTIEGFKNGIFPLIKKIFIPMVKEQIHLQHLTQALMNVIV